MKEEKQKTIGEKIPQKKFEVVEHSMLELAKFLNIMENSGWEVTIHMTEEDKRHEGFYRVLYSKRMVRNEW